MNAVRNGSRIECGACGAMLFKFNYKAKNGQTPSQFINYHMRKAAPLNEGEVAIEIKCKHKDKGKTCNTINEILL
jgi:hypothetical protein